MPIIQLNNTDKNQMKIKPLILDSSRNLFASAKTFSAHDQKQRVLRSFQIPVSLKNESERYPAVDVMPAKQFKVVRQNLQLHFNIYIPKRRQPQ